MLKRAGRGLSPGVLPSSSSCFTLLYRSWLNKWGYNNWANVLQEGELRRRGMDAEERKYANNWGNF